MATKYKIERGEWPLLIVSFLLYFCVLGGYFAVRPVRETIGTILGRSTVADLYGATWALSLLTIPAYGLLCTVFRRQTMLTLVYSLVALALAGIGVVFAIRGENSIITGKCFYVMISVLNLFMVSILWSFLLEVFNTEQVKRLVGIIAAGGTAGALVGPYVTGLVVRSIGNSGVLFMGAGVYLCAIGCQLALIRLRRKSGSPTDEKPLGRADSGGIGGILLKSFAGVRLVAKSPYLIGIATFVVLLAAVNTFLYFEQLELVTAAFEKSADRTAFFSNMDSTVQGLTILIQLFATGRVAAKWGVGFLLTIVPIVMIAGLVTLALVHTLSVLAVVFVMRRVGEYAFVRPGREMLFSPLDAETKYKAKNFIDVPVYRGGDAVISQLSDYASTHHWPFPALIGAGFAAVWAVNGWWLGRAARPVPGS